MSLQVQGIAVQIDYNYNPNQILQIYINAE